MNIRLSCLLALFFVSADMLCAQSNPNHKDGQLDVGLAVHGKKFDGDLPAKAQSQYEAARDQLQKLTEASPKGLSAKAIGAAHLEVAQLRRKGELLILLGESAGLDYVRRYEKLNANVQWQIAQFGKLPAGERALEQIRAKLRAQAPGRQRAATNIEQLVGKNKWLEAENLLYKALDTLDPDTCFLPTGIERSPKYQPFENVQRAIDGTMKGERIAAAQKMHAETRAAETPDFEETLSQVTAAIDSVGKTGSATWEEETVSGPQLVTKMGEAWSEVQVATLRCRTLDWLLLGIDAQSGFMPQPTSGSEADKPTEFEKAYAEFSGGMADAFVRLIKADANRVTAAEATTLYVAYLEEIALLARQCSIDLSKKLEPALGELLAKSPALSDAATKYAEATDELLRWRMRTAQALAANRQSKYPAVTEQHFKATTSTKDYRGLYPIQNPDIHDAEMLGSAPEILKPALEKLMGKTGTFDDIIRLAPGGKLAIGRYKSRTYATVAIDVDLADALKALNSDLMVTDSTPPLTLNAMFAVKTAERGDFRAVGGAINGMFLESLLTRFAALPQSAGVILPLGEIPREPIHNNPVAHLLMRYDIFPHWLQHDYFFVEIISEPAA